MLTTLFIRGRHFGSSCWLNSPKLTLISTAHVKFRFVLVWRLRNAKEIIALMEKLSAIYPKRLPQEMRETATEDSYSFWHVNSVSKGKREAFHVRLCHEMAAHLEKTIRMTDPTLT